MTRTEFRLLERLRVRWSEIDAQNIVFNGHYLTYFDTAVAGYWRALAMPYAQTMQRLGGDLFVRKATLTYEASARYDDLIDVGMRCSRVGRSSMSFDGAVFRQDQLLVTCELIYVFADPQTQTAQPVPEALRTVLRAFEAGEPMVDVRRGGWEALAADAQAVRTAVFVQEQQIPAAIVSDGADAHAVHAVAYNRFGVALGSGRLLQDGPRLARIGRMATVQAVRGSGLGRALLRCLVDAARERGDDQVTLHAQLSARAFYERAGFEICGAVFEEAGIAHIEMTRRL